ncbi:TPA_asm: coat protein [ssRNA phage Gerhypos.1_33]|uniref:Coat protein n=2 Tax=Leviviricetes TaxID=2842243 RepID=A0A8S5L415_9VIRU|nr:coat protein [ssRNA phage Gerhypos.1_33]QDH90815.1 MAG: hypothetical protein H1Bulk30173_000003 [Leviviridae sp.]DAD52069.1 TPA_asm: coat protein [ssRNA phage Gerhypos.1_33]
MFTDPQSVTISGVAASLPRTSSSVNAGIYTTNDGTESLQISHAYGKRTRRTIALVIKKYAADPAVPSQNVPVSATLRVTIDHPVQGYSVAELQAALVGFIANLTASSNANMAKLLGGEN